MFLRQIEYLQAVIEQGNFYLAAEQCHVSQYAISQQIKKLEDELGVKLLERHNRTFSLTPAGEHFYRKSLVISESLSARPKELPTRIRQPCDSVTIKATTEKSSPMPSPFFQKNTQMSRCRLWLEVMRNCITPWKMTP